LIAMKIVSAEFVGSSRGSSPRPRPGLPEVAFAGRSNVGKSSLINTLARRKKLARTSGSPGHTRAINFFSINGRYCFADLPGYGYAKVSKEERKRWRSMVEDYFRERDELKAVVVIMDIRRTPGDDEVGLIGFLTGEGITPVLVATKADKFGKQKRASELAKMARAFGIDAGAITLFSAKTGEGRDALWKKIRTLLDDAAK